MRSGVLRGLAALGLALAPLSALASEDTQFTQCPTAEQRVILQDFQDRLSGAETPEEAKKLALRKIRLGQKAIRHAERLVDDREGIARAQDRLDSLERDILQSETQDEVAAQFGQLGAQAVNCHYDTVEVVVIVVGFVLGILPGLLFLILFC